jgi:hypothetical protein
MHVHIRLCVCECVRACVRVLACVGDEWKRGKLTRVTVDVLTSTTLPRRAKIFAFRRLRRALASVRLPLLACIPMLFECTYSL